MTIYQAVLKYLSVLTTGTPRYIPVNSSTMCDILKDLSHISLFNLISTHSCAINSTKLHFLLSRTYEIFQYQTFPFAIPRFKISFSLSSCGCFLLIIQASIRCHHLRQDFSDHTSCDASLLPHPLLAFS